MSKSIQFDFKLELGDPQKGIGKKKKVKKSWKAGHPAGQKVGIGKKKKK